MQVVIMAAGKGKRLGSLVGKMPKGLLEISGKPIIDWDLSYFSTAGIKKIVMTVGYMKEKYIEHLRGKGVSFVFNPFYKYGQVLSSFWFLRNEISLKEDLIFCHVDTIIEKNIFDMLIEKKGEIVLPFDSGICDEESMKVKIDPCNNLIEKITKEMSCSDADGEFIGFAKISKEVLPDLINACEELINKEFLMSFFEEALQLLRDKNKYSLIPLDIKGLQWVEIDFPSDYERAKLLDLPSLNNV